MDLPINAFKAALKAGRQQTGLWCTLASPYAAEVVAGSGFDWLLFDTEHSPSDLETVLALLQAVSAYPVTPVVRPAWNDAVLIKRFLDIGVQTLLVPFVQSADEARAAVAAVRYPPDGVRGVSSATRATRFGRIPDYARRAADEICLLVQVETQAAIAQIEAIAAVEGVDGIFIGPADLAASMGFVGQSSHPDVIATTVEAVRRVVAAGKPAGVLTTDDAFVRRCIAAGTTFTAVGVDTGLLARGADTLRQSF